MYKLTIHTTQKRHNCILKPQQRQPVKPKVLLDVAQLLLHKLVRGLAGLLLLRELGAHVCQCRAHGHPRVGEGHDIPLLARPHVSGPRTKRHGLLLQRVCVVEHEADVHAHGAVGSDGQRGVAAVACARSQRAAEETHNRLLSCALGAARPVRVGAQTAALLCCRAPELQLGWEEMHAATDVLLEAAVSDDIGSMICTVAKSIRRCCEGG